MLGKQASHSKKFSVLKITAFAIFASAFTAASAFSVKFWFENKELKALKPLQPITYYTVSSEKSFLDGSDVVSVIDEGAFQTEKKKLIEAKSDFIEADLKTMKMTLYEKGEPKTDYPIKAKGKEGSFWETTTGVYSVGVKLVNHFSSIARVWMPYGIQFYGNFFIHGWPYHSDGTPIVGSYSGGCIRLSTDDAKKVFEFAKNGMPVLVFEEKPKKALYEALQLSSGGISSAPDISAGAAVIADLDTGEILLDKEVDRVNPVGALTKSMTALTVREVVNLERVITAQASMLNKEKSDGLLKISEMYRGFDLLYPLLMQSSNDAASVLGGFLGEKETVNQMNKKARALGMSGTNFVDTTGESEENVSTLRDLSRLAKYILDKRGFVFGVSIGTQYPEDGTVKFSNLQNYNPFAGEKNITGVIGGRSDAVGFTILTVWKESKEGGPVRNLLIGVLGSNDANGDIIALRDWFEGNFGMK